MKAHGQFKRRAHIASLIGVHVAVGQRCRAVDGESSTILPTMSTRNASAGTGAWTAISKQKTHSISHVVMNIAVSQICRAMDEDATTL